MLLLFMSSAAKDAELFCIFFLAVLLNSRPTVPPYGLPDEEIFPLLPTVLSIVLLIYPILAAMYVFLVHCTVCVLSISNYYSQRGDVCRDKTADVILSTFARMRSLISW